MTADIVCGRYGWVYCGIYDCGCLYEETAGKRTRCHGCGCSEEDIEVCGTNDRERIYEAKKLPKI